MFKIYVFDDLAQMNEEQFVQILTLLPASDRREILRYRTFDDRKSKAVTAVILQKMIKEEFGISQPVICRSPQGKPYLKEYPQLFFNVSHCREACAVAFADRPVGIDVQEIRSFSQVTAEWVCSESELTALAGSDNPDRFFIRMWTMKESYVKMTGIGISVDLKLVDTTKLEAEILTSEKNNYYLAVSFADCGKVGTITNEAYNTPIQYLEFAEIL